ncbi:MAG: Eco57I restriction-modification methylase domain-containing protein [Rikenellaceae bacterium]
MKKRKLGDVYTSNFTVNYMLDMVGFVASKNLSNILLIEPSCGEGAFVIEIVKRLKQSSENFGFCFYDTLQKNFTFYDTDISKIKICIEKLKAIGINFPDKIFRCEDFLLSQSRFVDIVIGNPPYIRHERIDETLKAKYKNTYSTFKYRADLYIAFFEKSLSLLNDNGKHCFICSNRWFKNQYGAPLRELISREYSLKTILNMEHTNPFEESVMAYPAITLIERTIERAKYLNYLSVDSIESLRGGIEYSRVPNTLDSSNWTELFNPTNYGGSLYTIPELGFNIGIGVATGADDIFIGSKLYTEIEPSLLLPIITTKDIAGDGILWRGNYIFNPFDKNGNIIELADYPKAHQYLSSHSERLKRRYVSKRNPQYWFRTIDKIKSELLTSPKIILPDIATSRFLQIDEGKFYPHHNLYYIKSDCIYKLKILCSILMSDFVYNQLVALSSSMNGGYPRWQSQNIKRLKIPNFIKWDSSIKEDIINLYDKKDIASLNTLINSTLS